MSSARLAPFPSTNCWQSTHGGCASVSSSTRPPRPWGAQLCSSLCEGHFRAHSSKQLPWEFQGNLILGETMNQAPASLAGDGGRGETGVVQSSTEVYLSTLLPFQAPLLGSCEMWPDRLGIGRPRSSSVSAVSPCVCGFGQVILFLWASVSSLVK